MNKTIEFDWEGKPGLDELRIPTGNIVGKFHISVTLTPVDPEPEISYMMCAEQPAQIDCRRESCKFHSDSGKCTNPSPALTLNSPPSMTNGKWVCWSYEEDTKRLLFVRESFGNT